MENENNIWKVIGILFIAYIIIWFWPVAFHRPFFGDNPNVHDVVPPPVYIYEPDGPSPIGTPDMRFGGDGYEDPVPPKSDEPMVACTMDARECPDGSYVGRVGPNCEFAPCPRN